MVKKVTKKAKVKKIDPLVALLLEVEKVGQGGFALCAPNILKNKVSAFKYSATGKLTAQDKLRKMNIFKYLELKNTETFNIEKKKGKSKEYVIEYYLLSEKGKDALFVHSLEEERLKKKALENLEGLETILQNHHDKRDSIAKAIQQLPVKEKSWKDELTKNIEVQTQNTAKQIASFQQEMQNKLQKIITDLSSFQQNITNNLETTIHTELEKMTSHYEVQMNSIKTEYQKYNTEENFLAKAIDGKLSEEKSKVIQKFGQPISFDAMEVTIEQHLMPLLKDGEYKDIHDLHQEIMKQGVEISPGYFNDILVSLKNKEKVVFGSWSRSVDDIKHYENIIFSKYLYFCVRKN